MAVDPVVEVADNGEEMEKVEEEQSKTPEKKKEEETEEEKSSSGAVPASPDPYYPPIIYLPEVVVNSGEDGEEQMFKRRAKLYRYAHEEAPPEWKERGTGEVKIMKHPETGSARIIMRREKTMKVCANHSILPWMDMRPNCGSQKAWVWKTQADFADALCEEDKPKQETLAIRFGTMDNAKAFQDSFLEARNYVLENQARQIREEERGEGDGEESKEEEIDEEEKSEGKETVKDVAEVIEGGGDAGLADKLSDLTV